ncbi:MAG: SpoIIE family protein phosphatase [Mogibacterium sp.]|nr:SpoIIE family protein phosphatase [Mogibacterium sp.]
MNDLCIDIDYSQLYKHGQKIGGDVFFLDRDDNSNVITAILSDGLGSGVRANVLASLTAHMASKMSLSPMDLEKSAEVIMDTLPVDSEKGISYSTFTIAKLIFSDNKSFIRIELIEYDNPDSLRFIGAEPVEWEKRAFRLKRKAAIKEEIIYSSEFEVKDGYRLIFFSDGVAQSGISLGSTESAKTGVQEDAAYAAFRNTANAARHNQILPSARNNNKGWGTENVSAFVQNVLQKDPDISSRQLARAIVTEAYKNDGYKPNDDITCCVINIRKPRRTLIVTGAPRNRESDKRLGELIKNFDGQVIVCGGTTAKIVARELGKDVKADNSPAGNLPPASKIDGIELVTEGMLTLTEVAKRLSNKTLLKHMSEDAAKQMIRLLRETDQIEIVVGTKINDEIEDPSTAAKIGLRFPAIDSIHDSLIKNYFKECEVLYL